MKKISLFLAVLLLIISMNFSYVFANGTVPWVSATQEISGGVLINWSCPDTDISGFRLTVYKNHLQEFEKYLSAASGSYEYTKCEDGATYDFYIDVFYKDGTSTYSSATLAYSIDSLKPKAPSGLAAKIDSSGNVTLTWKDNSTTEQGFEIAKEDSNGDGGIINIPQSGAESYIDSVAHAAGMTYKYKVRAYNAYGATDYSNEVSVTFPNAASDVPSNCAAQLQSDGSVKVTWKDNSGWETGFTVVRTDGAGVIKYIDTAANAISYTDTEKLTAGTTYQYKVCAHDDGGQSGYSNQVSITISVKTPTVPTAPSGLTAKQNQDKITLNWKDNSDNETGFLLTRTDNKSKTVTSATLAAGANTYTDAQGIAAGTTYTYELKAVNAAGSSDGVKANISAVNMETVTDLILDGTQSSWAKSEIIQAYGDGLLYDGVLSNFKKNITREEFCTIAVKMYEKISGKKAASSDNPFKDTNNDDIVKAFRLGIVKGTSAGIFSPDSKITRQEICVMITRCLEACVSGININSTNALSFDDKNQIASWAKDSMGYCNSVGIMNGVGNNKIAPLANTTREQAIALIERTFQEYN